MMVGNFSGRYQDANQKIMVREDWGKGGITWGQSSPNMGGKEV